MEEKPVIYEVKGHVAFVTLNRPERLNAQSAFMSRELLKAFKEADSDPEVKAVVFHGNGRAFCSGHDLTEEVDKESPEKGFADVEMLQGITNAIMGMGKPVIAAVQGYALGSGCEWVTNCDIIIAAEGTKFGFPETQIGSAVGNAGTKLLPLLIGLARAREMILTGRLIDSTEAKAWGLVNSVVPPETLMDEAVAVAQKLAENPVLSNRLAKLAINRALHLDIHQTLQTELKDMFATDTISRR
jgi:enoyl-CoA hydratase/carnithine racemase